METDYTRGKIKDFYAGVKRIKEGFKPKLCICTNKEGEVVTDENQVLRRWTEYFQELLNPEDTIVENNEDIQTHENNNVNDKKMKKSTYTEVIKKNAIKKQKNGKAPGKDNITVELISTEVWKCVKKYIASYVEYGKRNGCQRNETSG